MLWHGRHRGSVRGLLFGARLVPRVVPGKRVQRVDEPLADVGRGVELDAGDQQAPKRARVRPGRPPNLHGCCMAED